MPGTLPVCRPLVTAPGNLRKGLSRENDQANTHNEVQEYSRRPTRVKTSDPACPPPARTGPHPPHARRRTRSARLRPPPQPWAGKKERADRHTGIHRRARRAQTFAARTTTVLPIPPPRVRRDVSAAPAPGAPPGTTHACQDAARTNHPEMPPLASFTLDTSGVPVVPETDQHTPCPV